MRNRLLPFVLSTALLLAARPLAAQRGADASATLRPRFAASVVAGVSQFDLSGTGTAAVVGARVEAEVWSWLVAEGALGYFQPEEQFGGRTRFTIPEVQLQLQLPLRRVRPYVGVGGGYVLGSGHDSQPTMSAAGGLRVPVPATRMDVRGELRLRGIGESFGGSTAEWTLGAGYRF